MTTATKPLIVHMDIETLPAVAYVWRLWDENIGIDQVISPSRVVSASWKFEGDGTLYFAAEWQEGRQEMLERLRAVIDAADAVVTYNGDKFDLPKLMGEFVVEGIDPPAPPTSIDLYKTIRKLGYQSNKLAFVSPFLGIGKKVDTGGFELWKGVSEGDPKAQADMEKYNKQDVKLLGKLYAVLKPYITNHPHLHDATPDSCPACGSKKLHKRGYRRTRSYKIERLRCQDCSHWTTGKKQKVK